MLAWLDAWYAQSSLFVIGGFGPENVGDEALPLNTKQEQSDYLFQGSRSASG